MELQEAIKVREIFHLRDKSANQFSKWKCEKVNKQKLTSAQIFH